MNRTVITLTLATLILCLLWLGLMFGSLSAAGPLDSFEAVLAHVANPDPLFYWNYFNAGLVTLSVTGFFAALYRLVQVATPTRAVVGLVFVPVYCVLNLFCYFSQITLVPALAASLAQPETAPVARMLLAELIHEWPLSSVAFFNSLAYAVLGIPSVLYGFGLMRKNITLRGGGLLLVLSGLAGAAGLLGLLTGSSGLAMGTLVSGGLFTISLPLIAIGLRE